MSTNIYKPLKDILIKHTNTDNRSTTELCATELTSGNFIKAIDLSEELIKKDFNNSAGWAFKAISQSYLFDYDDKLHLLKSSIMSFEEFTEKSTLTVDEYNLIEVAFITTMLNRTVELAQMRIETAKQLRKQALAEKTKAGWSNLGILVGALSGLNGKSDAGKILGYGGAVAGAIAAANFMQNSEMLEETSKGVFGVAIVNILFSMNFAKRLNTLTKNVDPRIKAETDQAIYNYNQLLNLIYKQVIENLLFYNEGLKKGGLIGNPIDIKYIKSIKNIFNEPEGNQFIYLSKKLGIENSSPEFSLIEQQISAIQKISEFQIMTSAFISIVIGLLTGVATLYLGIGLGVFSKDYLGLKVATFVLIPPFYFLLINPIGKAGEFMKSYKLLIKSFKSISSAKNTISIEYIN
jgi:hypothetical protein